MSLVFADTLYWVAITRPDDSWTYAAQIARRKLGTVTLVTTEEVLMEVATALSRGGPIVRQAAVRLIRRVQQKRSVRVIQQTHSGFEDGLARYAARPDKSYSLTDCISMNVMEAQGIRSVLTNDRHFAQEGFEVLIS